MWQAASVSTPLLTQEPALALCVLSAHRTHSASTAHTLGALDMPQSRAPVHEVALGVPLAPCDHEEGVELGDAVPAGEVSIGREAQREEQQQERDHVVPCPARRRTPACHTLSPVVAWRGARVCMTASDGQCNCSP